MATELETARARPIHLSSTVMSVPTSFVVCKERGNEGPRPDCGSKEENSAQIPLALLHVSGGRLPASVKRVYNYMAKIQCYFATLLPVIKNQYST